MIRRKLLEPALPSPPAGYEMEVYENAVVRLPYRGSIGFSSFLNGGFERAEIQAFTTFCKPNTVVIDVGANIGIFTVAAARKLEATGQIWAIDPIEANLVRLRDNLDLNGLDNCEPICAAVSDATGLVEFHVSRDSAYSSVISEYARHGGELVEIEVPSITIDDLWKAADRPKVSAMKIDVEGFQIPVLRGAEEMIRHCLPSILLESEPERLHECEELLADSGYERTEQRGFSEATHLLVAGTSNR